MSDVISGSFDFDQAEEARQKHLHRLGIIYLTTVEEKTSEPSIFSAQPKAM